MTVEEILLWQAKEEGIEQGLERGDELRLTKMVAKMLNRGSTLIEISDFLEISIDRIIEIISKYEIK